MNACTYFGPLLLVSVEGCTRPGVEVAPTGWVQERLLRKASRAAYLGRDASRARMHSP